MPGTSEKLETTNDVDMEVAAVGFLLFDDAYLAWFTAESESERAAKTWWRSSGRGRTPAYAAYRAALDREEAAAGVLERRWSRARSCLTIAIGRRAV
jgi:hypothetical protein